MEKYRVYYYIAIAVFWCSLLGILGYEKYDVVVCYFIMLTVFILNEVVNISNRIK